MTQAAVGVVVALLSEAKALGLRSPEPGLNEVAGLKVFVSGIGDVAAKLAAERGVRIYTVGIGTKQGATLSVDGWSMRVRHCPNHSRL